MATAIDQLLLDIGRELGIQGLRVDAQGCCRLVFDGRRMLELRAAPAQRRVLLSCRLDGALLQDSQAGLLLRANAWGAGTAGAWFAVDEVGRICLQHAVALMEDSARLLLNLIEGLLDAVERWEQRLRAPQAGSQPGGMAAWMQKV
ncbi:MAG: type III secretion system chaperone [Proteobacteria bacterium]|nr:type III secretion system chaperone [Pseudomonadota bacterium]